MGNRRLVIVRPDFLASAAAARSVRSTGFVSSNPSTLQADRHEALETLVEGLWKPNLAATTAGPGGAVMSMISGSSGPTGLQPYGVNPGAPVPIAANAAGPGKPSATSYDILAGVGALVLDDAEFDMHQLGGIYGIEVVPDAYAELHEPPVHASVAAAPVPQPWHLTQIGALPRPALAGDGVLVGVLDTGIDANHSEFAGKTVHFQQFNRAGARVAGAANDAGQHGTHVCGLIAGLTCGVAPGASLAVAQVLNQPTAVGLSGSLIQIANGLNWLLTHPFRPNRVGVDVVNASLSSPTNPYLQMLLAGGNVLLVASIGNNGALGVGRDGSPGNYPGVLGVGASDPNDEVAIFSDWALPPVTKPELSAPGVDVVSSVPGGTYAKMSGTSMASPIACGVAARELAATPGFQGNPAGLLGHLQTKVVPVRPCVGNGNLGGVGRIQC